MRGIEHMPSRSTLRGTLFRQRAYADETAHRKNSTIAISRSMISRVSCGVIWADDTGWCYPLAHPTRKPSIARAFDIMRFDATRGNALRALAQVIAALIGQQRGPFHTIPAEVLGAIQRPIGGLRERGRRDVQSGDGGRSADADRH
jgi:hypothetical protein